MKKQCITKLKFDVTAGESESYRVLIRVCLLGHGIAGETVVQAVRASVPIFDDPVLRSKRMNARVVVWSKYVARLDIGADKIQRGYSTWVRRPCLITSKLVVWRVEKEVSGHKATLVLHGQIHSCDECIVHRLKRNYSEDLKEYHHLKNHMTNNETQS